ncbi:hypothetical protein L596_004590 [Steinernema carpocapsae]|uniref:Uncharacterized protein n=1 Tax=Steinernema carpocapsae TaxID=34508 RepID=A0A4U8UW89_STECR|nr:hypothetical protein L596_004590 [Steinernema carpocapsae]
MGDFDVLRLISAFSMLLRLVFGLLLVQAAFGYVVRNYNYGMDSEERPLPEARFRSLHEAQFVKDRMMSVIGEILKQRRLQQRSAEK